MQKQEHRFKLFKKETETKKILIWKKADFSANSSGLSYYKEHLIKNLNQFVLKESSDTTNLFFYSRYKKNELNNFLIKSYFYNLICDHLITPIKLKLNRMAVVFFPTWKLPFLKIYSSAEVCLIPDFSPLESPHSHSFLERIYFRATIKKCIKRSKAIITISKTIKKEIIDRYGLNDSIIKVIYPDIHSIYKNQINQPRVKKEQYIFYVGGYRTRKNVENLIKALPYINNEYKLMLSGSKNKLSKKIIKYIKNNNLSTRIIQTEYFPISKLVMKYKRAKIFVYPSLYEGFGLPPLEAMACGTATAVSDIPALNETVGDAALKFNPTDPKDIADKINILINDQNLRKKLIKKGYEQIKKYNWQRETKKLYKLLIDTAKEK
jgi:glycosyltransferase involved in cell wall biosynthesis